MSDTAEDLIILSPCARSRKVHTSNLSPTAPTQDFDYKLEASSQNSRTLQQRFRDTMAYDGSVRKEVALEGKDETSKAVECHSKNTDSPSIIRRQHGSVVIITPLPKSITKRHVLCRVRGGKVLSCILSEFCGCIIAAITFQDPASAQLYVDLCAETSNKELWSLTSDPNLGPNFETSTQVDVAPRVYVYKDAPGLGTIWCPEDIPSSPKAYPASATRCLSLENCHIERMSKLWAELGLNHSEHLRNQLDDMWIDRPNGDGAAGKASGTLHIWFSDINTAMQAQQRCPGLEYELDPCSTSPHESLYLGHEDSKEHTEDGAHVPSKLQIRYHSFPFVSLLDLHKTSVMNGLLRGLLDPYEVFERIRTSQPEVEVKRMSLTERLIHALNMHGKKQRMNRHGGTKTKMLPLLDDTLPANGKTTTDALESPGYVVHSKAGIDDLFMDDEGLSGVYRRSHLSDNSFSSTARDYDPVQASTAYPHALHSQDNYTDHKGSAIRMRSRSEEPPQTRSTHHGDAHSVDYPSFGLTRPQPGYSLQFPPPMSGEPAVMEHPFTRDQRSPESPVQGHLARRLQNIAKPGYAPLPSSSAFPSRSTENTTGYQSGRSDGSGCPFSGAINVGTGLADSQAYTDVQIEPNIASSGLASSWPSRSVSASFLASDHDERTVRLVDVAHLQDHDSSEAPIVSGNDTKNARECDSPASASTAPLQQTTPDYSRETWDDATRSNDVFWTVSIEEFRAMNDDQWKAFGTSFYVPPPGFNTAKRHVVKLE